MERANLITLSIHTPTGALCKAETTLASLPAQHGDMGMLYGHENMLVQLKEGNVTLYDHPNGGQARETFYIHAGFAEITPEQCNVLVSYGHKLP